MIRRIALATTAATAAALVVAVPWSPVGATVPAAAAAAPVDHSIALPLGRFTGMVVDQPAGLVFFAGDNPIAADGHGGGVAVSHLDGSQLLNIHGTTATAGLALGPDGKVYAAEESGVIAAIDPSKLATNDGSAVTNHPTGDAKCPTSIAFAGSSLWFTYECAADGTSGLANLDPATDTVTVNLSHPTTSPRALIASVPNHDSLLAGSNLGGNSEVDLVTIADTTATLTNQSAAAGAPAISVTPDGSNILATSPALNGTAFFSTTDLSQGASSYPAGSQGVGSAMSADSRLLATVSGADSFSDTISTYYLGDHNPVRIYDTSTPGSANQHQDTIPAGSGVAWTGSTLLTVYVDYLGGWPLLKVLNTALQRPTTMTFSAPRTAGRAKRIVLTGSVSGVASGQVVITKRDLAGAHTLGTAVTDANGKFSFADVPAVGGANTYVAKFLGTQFRQAASHGAAVSVTRGTVPLTLKLNASTYTFRQAARLTIHLASHDVKKVQLWAKPGPQPLHYLKTLTVDKNGNAVTSNSMAYNTIFVVKFYGDYYYNARSVSATVQTLVGVAVAMAGEYATSGAYKLYHAGSKAYQAAATGPDKSGRCLDFEAQEYANGSWTTVATLTCDPISDGIATADFTGPANVPFRFRAIYRGDNYNLANSSDWAYFTFR